VGCRPTAENHNFLRGPPRIVATTVVIAIDECRSVFQFPTSGLLRPIALKKIVRPSALKNRLHPGKKDRFSPCGDAYCYTARKFSRHCYTIFSAPIRASRSRENRSVPAVFALRASPLGATRRKRIATPRLPPLVIATPTLLCFIRTSIRSPSDRSASSACPELVEGKRQRPEFRPAPEQNRNTKH
jgi:hypothetical protein